MSKRESFYLMRGVGSSNKDVWEYLKAVGGYFVVTATSIPALPPTDKEMYTISTACPNVVFPPGIKRGLAGPKKVVDLREALSGKMASIVYVDEECELLWAAYTIDMKDKKFVQVEVEGTELVVVRHFLLEVVEQGS